MSWYRPAVYGATIAAAVLACPEAFAQRMDSPHTGPITTLERAGLEKFFGPEYFIVNTDAEVSIPRHVALAKSFCNYGSVSISANSTTISRALATESILEFLFFKNETGELYHIKETGIDFVTGKPSWQVDVSIQDGKALVVDPSNKFDKDHFLNKISNHLERNYRC